MEPPPQQLAPPLDAAAQANDYSARLAGEIRACVGRYAVKHSDLADAVGISRTALGRKLAGRGDFTVAEVEAVARYFQLTPAELLQRVEAPA